MSGFKLICCKCGSDKIVEKSGESTLDWIGSSAIHGELVQRKCTECNNEDFTIFRTWIRED